jgi:hypothetical protein
MRPFESYRNIGAEAWLSGLDENANPYPDDSLAGIEWLEGHLDAAVESGDLGETAEDCARVYLEETRAAIRTKRTALSLDLPTVISVCDAIGTPAQKWRNNCFAVSVAALESGILDKYQEKHGVLVPTYGMYEGPLASGKRSFNRHGWLESRQGHIVDPTRWVFTEEYPRLWAGSIDDYDLGGMRLRSMHRPPRPPAPSGEDIHLGINDPGRLAVFDRMLGDRSVSTTGRIADNRLHWAMTAPLEHMGDDAEWMIAVADRLGRGGIVPLDTRLWVEFSLGGYDPDRLRASRSDLPEYERKKGRTVAFSPF